MSHQHAVADFQRETYPTYESKLEDGYVQGYDPMSLAAPHSSLIRNSTWIGMGLVLSILPAIGILIWGLGVMAYTYGTAGDQDVLKGTGSLANCFTDWGSTANRVFDMSGNAKEWAVGPASDPADTRRLRGGSYNNTQGGMKCNFRFAVADNTFQFPNVGFRCCRSTAP